MHISCWRCVAVLRYLLHYVCDQPLSVGESSVMTNPKSSAFSPLAVLKAQSLLVDPEHQVHSQSMALSRGSLLCYLNQMSQQQTSSWVVIDAHVFKLSRELSQSFIVLWRWSFSMASRVGWHFQFCVCIWESAPYNGQVWIMDKFLVAS